MLECRRLESTPDLAAFRSRYLARAHLGMEPAWLARQRVLGFFLRGELVAGYVESDELSRSFLGLSEAERAGVLAAIGGDPARPGYEICALWMGERCRRTVLAHARVWATIVLRAAASGAPFVVASAEQDELNAIYQSLGGQLVWDSPSECHPGHRNRIFVYRKGQATWALLRACHRSLRRAPRRATGPAAAGRPA
jgi:hypothetical protein